MQNKRSGWESLTSMPREAHLNFDVIKVNQPAEDYGETRPWPNVVKC
jgi:hypothetical protein